MASGEDADQRVHDSIVDARADRQTNLTVGAPPPSVGGGGSEGKFVFTDVGELDDIITRLTTLSHRIQQRGLDLDSAIRMVEPPAQDTSSRGQVTATKQSLSQALAHNTTLLQNLDDYIQKLQRAKAEMVSTDEGNAHTLTHQDGG